MRYRLQRKETVARPNILGNRSFPVYSYRWKDIALSNDRGALETMMPNEKDYRIEDTEPKEDADRKGADGGEGTMINKYQYTIHAAPVTKKNSQQIAVNRSTGRTFVVQSRAYKEFEAAAGAYLLPRPDKPISVPVNVKAVFYTKTRRRVDTSNLMAALLDVLVKYGIIADDNRDIVAATDGTRTYHDKDNPRVEVEITPFNETGYEIFGRTEV